LALAIFFCAEALSVTWCDLWDFLGGAIVAADASTAGSAKIARNSKLQMAARLFI
jgi:hypothetical protein